MGAEIEELVASPKFQLNELIVVPEAGVLASVNVNKLPEKHCDALSIENNGVGAGKFETVIAKVEAEDVPQAFVAVTESEPELELLTRLIEFVVEEPVQPLGSVQVYEFAPLTAATE